MRSARALLLSFLLLLPAAAQALTLQEGLKIVTESGRDVKIAESNQEAARGSVSLARSAWLPQINAYANETKLRYQPTAIFEGAQIQTADRKFLSYGVTANQLLYDFGKTSSSIDAAKYAAKARDIEISRAKNQAELQFTIAYYNLLEEEKLLQVAGEDVQRYEAHKKDAEVRYNAGVVTKNEVLEADVKLANSQQRYVVADNLRSLRASQVNSLLQRPLNEQVQTEEVKTSPAAGIKLEDAWAIAEAESPEIKVIDATIKSKEESIKSTRAEYMPNLFVSGAYQYQENEFMLYPRNLSVVVGATFNLFSGGATAAKVHTGKSELQALKINREKIFDAVRLDVKSAYLDLQSSAQRIDVMKASVAQAQENLRLQRLRYQEGVGTAIEVLDAVTLLSTAQSDSWTALYSYERAEAGLLYAMGRDLKSMYESSGANTKSDTKSQVTTTN